MCLHPCLLEWQILLVVPSLPFNHCLSASIFYISLFSYSQIHWDREKLQNNNNITRLFTIYTDRRVNGLRNYRSTKNLIDLFDKCTFCICILDKGLWQPRFYYTVQFHEYWKTTLNLIIVMFFLLTILCSVIIYPC